MRFAVSIPPFTEPATVVAIARDAEGAGWDGVFLWDHLQWSRDVAPDVHDPWVLLGAIAQVTDRVRLGTLVTPLSRRRPWVVAKQLTTLDHLSGGRAVFSVGLGEPPDRDFGDLGDEADPRVRAAMLDEGLGVLDALLRGGPSRHSGEHYTVEADLLPLPVQRPRPPIWVAGVLPNKRPLARARRWDGIVPIGPRELLTPDTLAEYLGGDTPDGWDVVASWAPGVPAADYAEAGATWLVESTWPVGDWEQEFHDRIRRDPRSD
ncbi:MAG: LLM class flavin-dependent oxidoreductase [Nocardioidaceae bacterium]|nr:LLM class flavin-dependent oxidoreductase [Nocardioidaceae bacterium]